MCTLDLFLLQGEAWTEFHALHEEIIGCLALVSALIDFGDGEDIKEGVFEEGLSARLFFWQI